MQTGLASKRVLITGSSSGTGAATARSFAAEGATVLVHGLEAGQADAVAEELRAGGATAESLWGDICNDDGAAELARQALAGGAVDVLVNNYGVADGGSWQATETEAWVEQYQRNVLSGVRLVRALTPAMRERGEGRVIFLGTVGAVRPRAAMPHYYTAKAALPALVVSLAKELSGTGITVNCVSPGILRTAEVEAWARARAERKGWGTDWAEIERRAVADMMGPNPSGRMGLPEEVAATVVFLASEAAAYINGVDLRVDGGAADCVR
jgi:3-oxoacyl-[acyl-carrier protein] reductase